jgi:polysaccharide pyruvyl transferase WcaK-like protein
MHTPMIGIVSYPKSAGFLRTVGQGDWLLPFVDLTTESLVAMIRKAWQERSATREELARLVPAEKEKARQTAVLLKEYLRR